MQKTDESVSCAGGLEHVPPHRCAPLLRQQPACLDLNILVMPRRQGTPIQLAAIGAVLSQLQYMTTFSIFGDGGIWQNDIHLYPCAGAIGRHIVVAFNIAWGVFILASLCLCQLPLL